MSAQTLVDSQTYNAPFTDNEIVTTAEIDNNSGDNAIEITIEYENIDPDGGVVQVGFGIQCQLEAEFAPGKWRPIAVQTDTIKGEDEAPVYQIDYSPQFLSDVGAEESMFEGSKPILSISRVNGTLPAKVRVCVVEIITDPLKDQLNSVTLSIWARKYNRD